MANNMYYTMQVDASSLDGYHTSGTCRTTPPSAAGRLPRKEANLKTVVHQKQPTAAVYNDPFIVSTPNSTKPDAAVRKYIRSHVMRGKNRRRGTAKQQHATIPPPPDQDPDAVPGPGLDYKMMDWLNGTLDGSEGRYLHPKSDLVRMVRGECMALFVPKVIGNELSFVRFADPIRPQMVSQVLKFFAVIKQYMHPLEMCVDTEEMRPHLWVDYLSIDKAYIHSILFAAQALPDVLESKDAKVGRQAIMHLTNTLRLLQGNLANKSLATTDFTIAAVLILIMVAGATGDADGLEKHMLGLSHMVRLRGGIVPLRENPMLQMKVCRSDIALTHEKGTKPFFFSSPSDISLQDEWPTDLATSLRNLVSPNSSSPQCTPSLITVLCSPPSPANNLLSLVWTDLHEFSQTSNNLLSKLMPSGKSVSDINMSCILNQTSPHQKIPAHIYHAVLVASQYRLLRLEDSSSSPTTDPKETLLRLGMLAFCTTVFLHIEVVKWSYTALTQKLRRSVLLMSTNNSPHNVPGLGYNGTENVSDNDLMKLNLWFLFQVFIAFHQQPMRGWAKTKNVTNDVPPPPSSEEEELIVKMVGEILEALGIMQLEHDQGVAALEEKIWEILREHMWADLIQRDRGRVLLERALRRKKEIRKTNNRDRNGIGLLCI
ncbi:hypothetical protein B0H66DRAFT_315914 [Apodospora peruviana]|uniref:Uncharacterized protein n=1 Tax=Apodospora peruviana TaxID=516989 RepID=A0AAE0HXB9_9PEZI|nr:hypothetical protein B0H66DRAFT_315914 [Apodospora peruviana]